MTRSITPTVWQSTASPISGDANVMPILGGQSLWVSKAPHWRTSKKEAASGRQVRSTQQTVPTWRFKVRYEVIRDKASNQELQTLYAFFNSGAGAAGSFFLQDPYDNSVTDQAIGTGDGTTATFQLGRTFNPSGAVSFFEPIYVVRGTPTVKVAGVSSSFWTLGNQGQITFSGGHIPTVGQAITWTGSFLFWVHFVDDQIEPEQAFSNLWSLSGLELESLKP